MVTLNISEIETPIDHPAMEMTAAADAAAAKRADPYLVAFDEHYDPEKWENESTFPSLDYDLIFTQPKRLVDGEEMDCDRCFVRDRLQPYHGQHHYGACHYHHCS